MGRATFRAKGQPTTPTTPTGMSTEQTPETSPASNISLYNVSLQPTQKAQLEKIVSPQNNFTAPYQSTSQFSRAGEPVS